MKFVNLLTRRIGNWSSGKQTCKKSGHESTLKVGHESTFSRERGKGPLCNCIHESTLELEEVMMDCEGYPVHG